MGVRLPRTPAVARFTMEEVDRGWEQMRKNIRAMKDGKSYVKVGVLQDARGRARVSRQAELLAIARGKPSSFDVAGLALLMELGSPQRKLPARPFIGGSFEANRPAYKAAMRRLAPLVYEGKRTVRSVLEPMGMRMVADVNRYVRQGSNLAPNAPSTLARKLEKGRSGMGKKQGPVAMPRPLIDTGRLLQAVTWQVVLEGPKQEIINRAPRRRRIRVRAPGVKP